MKTNTMPKGWSHYSLTHRITTDKMRPLGKANPDWSFKQSEHIESLKQGYPESCLRTRRTEKIPTTMFTRTLQPAPDWREQLSIAWEGLNQ